MTTKELEKLSMLYKSLSEIGDFLSIPYGDICSCTIFARKVSEGGYPTEKMLSLNSIPDLMDSIYNCVAKYQKDLERQLESYTLSQS